MFLFKLLLDFKGNFRCNLLHSWCENDYIHSYSLIHPIVWLLLEIVSSLYCPSIKPPFPSFSMQSLDQGPHYLSWKNDELALHAYPLAKWTLSMLSFKNMSLRIRYFYTHNHSVSWKIKHNLFLLTFSRKITLLPRKTKVLVIFSKLAFCFTTPWFLMLCPWSGMLWFCLFSKILFVLDSL